MPLTALTDDQRELLATWLPGMAVARDHSWGLVDTTVLEVTGNDQRYIVKAGGSDNHHLTREIHAHRNWTQPWVASGHAAALIAADEPAKILVARYLPGDLVLGSLAAEDPQIYRRAGSLLARFHAQPAQVDESLEAQLNEKMLAWLDGDHRIDLDSAARLRRDIQSWPEPSSTVVPTHGDWHPRNWLTDGAEVRVIDFGRAALRPAMTDFVRLAAREFRGRPHLEGAFVAGYGSDPREPDAWYRHRVREAISTAVWAYKVGDEPFEAQGHRMIADVLDEAAAEHT